MTNSIVEIKKLITGLHVRLDTIKERIVDLKDSSEELLVIASNETGNMRVRLESLINICVIKNTCLIILIGEI